MSTNVGGLGSSPFFQTSLAANNSFRAAQAVTAPTDGSNETAASLAGTFQNPLAFQAGGPVPDAATLLTQVASLMAEMLGTLAGTGQTAAQPGTPIAGIPAPVAPGPGAPGTPGAATDAEVEAAIDQMIIEDNPADAAELRESLLKVAQDPDGRALLMQSAANGATYEVDDYDQGSRGVTITPIDGNGDAAGSPTVKVDDASDLDTVAHELVHAATINDGNSRLEETAAFVIGNRIAAQNGQAQLQDATALQQTVERLYQDLEGPINDIRSSLAGLGITSLLTGVGNTA